MALRIPDKDALAARQNHAERFVVPAPKRASLAMRSSVADGSMFGHSPLAATCITDSAVGRLLLGTRNAQHLLCCLREELPAIIKRSVGSKPPRGGQGGVHDDLTPEFRSSGCNQRCCRSCLARDCARAIKWRLASSFPKSLDGLWGAARPLAKYVNEMSDGKFTIEPFAAGEIVPGPAGARCSRERHGRVRPSYRRILHRQESGADLRRVASVRNDARASTMPGICSATARS